MRAGYVHVGASPHEGAQALGYICDEGKMLKARFRMTSILTGQWIHKGPIEKKARFALMTTTSKLTDSEAEALPVNGSLELILTMNQMMKMEIGKSYVVTIEEESQGFGER